MTQVEVAIENKRLRAIGERICNGSRCVFRGMPRTISHFYHETDTLCKDCRYLQAGGGVRHVGAFAGPANLTGHRNKNRKRTSVKSKQQPQTIYR